MPYLIDTNVFLRLVSKTDPDRQASFLALQKLRASNDTLYYTTQVLAEFWVVCTRPVSARGGYGLSSASTEQKVKMIERFCQLLPESLATHQEWRRLVVAHSVLGVIIHDARLVAAMNVHGISQVLTFNKADFRRYPNLTIVSPDEIV
jgi:predicted nucleic acid-binding protein